jgi:hypothetical protein
MKKFSFKINDEKKKENIQKNCLLLFPERSISLIAAKKMNVLFQEV